MTTNNPTTKRSLGREYAFKFLYKHLLSDFNEEKEEIQNDPRAMEAALNLFDQSYNEEDIEHPDNQIDMHTKVFARSLILGSLKNEADNSVLVEKFLTNQNLQKVDLSGRCLISVLP